MTSDSIVGQGINSNEKIAKLEEELKIIKRKLSNSRNLSKAHNEDLARKTLEKVAISKVECEAHKNKLKKTQYNLDNIERQVKIKHLTKSCKKLKREKSNLEKQIDEICFDSYLHLPIKCDKKREKISLRETVKDVSVRHKRQSELLSSLEYWQNRDSELRKAAIRGDMKTVLKLIEQGLSVNTADETGNSAFKYACGQGHLHIVKAMIPFADLNDMESRWTPLHISVEYAHNDVAKMLIDNGADVNHRNQVGETPLHISCKKGDFECVKVLVKGGADMNAINSVGDTSLHHCAELNLGEIASFLIEYGANPKLTNLKGLTPVTIATTQRKENVYHVFRLLYAEDNV